MQNKKCKCGEDKLKCFSKDKSTRDGLCRICKECNKRNLREHYAANKQRYIKKASVRKKKHVEKMNELVLEYLGEHPCVDCEECDPVVLTFDHVRGAKKDNVANLVGRGNKWEVILAEINKCDVRCCNCHMRKTRISLGWMNRFSCENQ